MFRWQYCTVYSYIWESLLLLEFRLESLFIYISLFLSLFLSLSLSQSIENHMSIPPLFNYDYLQFVQRITILLMPQKGQPDYIFLRHVETKRVHTFTFIQIICMLLMWVTKSIKSISILFPLLVC